MAKLKTDTIFNKIRTIPTLAIVFTIIFSLTAVALNCHLKWEKSKNEQLMAEYIEYKSDAEKRIDDLIEENSVLFTRLSNYENADVLYSIDFILQKNKNVDIKTARHIAEAVIEQSAKFELDFKLVLAVIWQESRFNTKALSNQKASGLMQVIPATQKALAKILKIDTWDINDIETNILFGTAYLARLKKLYNGDIKLMLAAYNGGSTCAKKYKRYINGEIPVDSLSSENIGYIRSITNLYGKMNGNN